MESILPTWKPIKSTIHIGKTLQNRPNLLHFRDFSKSTEPFSRPMILQRPFPNLPSSIGCGVLFGGGSLVSGHPPGGWLEKNHRTSLWWLVCTRILLTKKWMMIQISVKYLSLQWFNYRGFDFCFRTSIKSRQSDCSAYCSCSETGRELIQLMIRIISQSVPD